MWRRIRGAFDQNQIIRKSILWIILWNDEKLLWDQNLWVITVLSYGFKKGGGALPRIQIGWSSPQVSRDPKEPDRERRGQTAHSQGDLRGVEEPPTGRTPPPHPHESLFLRWVSADVLGLLNPSRWSPCWWTKWSGRRLWTALLWPTGFSLRTWLTSSPGTAGLLPHPVAQFRSSTSFLPPLSHDLDFTFGRFCTRPSGRWTNTSKKSRRSWRRPRTSWRSSKIRGYVFSCLHER